MCQMSFIVIYTYIYVSIYPYSGISVYFTAKVQTFPDTAKFLSDYFSVNYEDFLLFVI